MAMDPFKTADSKAIVKCLKIHTSAMLALKANPIYCSLFIYVHLPVLCHTRLNGVGNVRQ